MRWTPGDRGQVEDRRGGGGFGIPLGIGGLVVIGLISLVTGTNFFSLLSSVSDTPVGTSAPASSTPEEERLVDFVGAVMQDAQGMWAELLPGKYTPTRAVIFRDAVNSACGFAQSVSGPFYCPGDRRVYLDLGFFDELERRFDAPGDFAQAYVLAHEIGHHVQNVLGIDEQVRARQREGNVNALSVRVELQADCFAGIWGHAAAKPGRAAAGMVELEPGDVEEGLNAAAAIGDDRLQRLGGGRVVPDSFTHGTSAQRVEWFRRGLERGEVQRCDAIGTMSAKPSPFPGLMAFALLW